MERSEGVKDRLHSFRSGFYPFKSYLRLAKGRPLMRSNDHMIPGKRLEAYLEG